MDIIWQAVDQLQRLISKLKSQICNSEEAAEKLSSEEAAEKLGISRQTLWLCIEDGIAVPGREKIRLPVDQLNPGKQYGYRIDRYKLDCFRRQRKRTIRKGKRTNNTNNLSGSQLNVSHILVRYVRGALIALIIIAPLALFIVFALYMYGPDWMTWTGLNGGFHKISTATDSTSLPQKITKTEEQPPAKMLWDWLQLLGVLAIPVVVGGGQPGSPGKAVRKVNEYGVPQCQDKNRSKIRGNSAV